MGKYYSYDPYRKSAGFDYSGRYSSGKKKSYSSWDDDFSWGGNWGSSWSFDEDKDSDLCIKAHESYFTPKGVDIEARLNWQDQTKTNKQLIKEMSRYFFYRMIDEKEYFEEKWADETKISEEEMPTYQAKKTFYEDLWEKFIPGETPLEKAIAVFKQLKEQQDGDTSGSKKKDLDPSKMDANAVQFYQEIYEDPDMNELLDTNAFTKQIKNDVLAKLSLVKNLGSQFKVEKEIEEKIVANSSVITKKIMRDYSQLGMLDLYQKMLPTFNLKLLSKDLIVNVPVDRTEHKQKIIIILDFSGSMCDGEKQEWVTAILVDRLRYAMKEEAEIFFSYFVHDPDRLLFTHCKDRKSVLNFWQRFSHSPNGGTTDIQAMVTRIGQEIDKGKLMNLNIDLREEKPEILIINDGQDHVSNDDFKYKSNAISVIDGPNTGLKNLCVKNNGKYVHTSAKTVRTWSTEGEQVLKV